MIIFNGETEFALVYFISVTKTIKNHRFRLKSHFLESFYMIDVWINNGCDWNVELIESQYINICAYRPLSGSFYRNFFSWTKKSKKKE